MKSIKKFGRDVLGIIFADMPCIIWAIIVSALSFVAMEHFASDYLRYEDYALLEIVFYFVVIGVIWLVVSEFKFCLIAAIFVAGIGTLNLNFFVISKLADDSLGLVISTVITIVYGVILNSICDWLIKKLKLESFFDFDIDDDEFEDDLFSDDELDDLSEDDTKKLVKIISKLDSDIHELDLVFAVNARKILKEYSMRTMDEGSQDEAWKERIEKIVAEIDEKINKKYGYEEYAKTYFYAAYFCRDKYSEIFTKEKANEYLSKVIQKGKFSVKEFEQLLEEGTKDFSLEEKWDVFMEVNQVMKNLLDIIEIMKSVGSKEEEQHD